MEGYISADALRMEAARLEAWAAEWAADPNVSRNVDKAREQARKMRNLASVLKPEQEG